MSSNYIFRIFAGDSRGCGFVAERHFITAYHVVKDFDAYICLGSEKIPLAKAALVYADFDKDACPDFVSEHDLAIFALPELACIDSPLVVAGAEMPQPGTQCVSRSYMTKVGQLGGSVFGWQSEEVLVECKATVNGDRSARLFAADTSMMLLPGSSGSPLLVGDEVVGMLLGGDDSRPYACFLSAWAIADAIDVAKNNEAGLHCVR